MTKHMMLESAKVGKKMAVAIYKGKKY